jgi:hypothetical protein
VIDAGSAVPAGPLLKHPSFVQGATLTVAKVKACAPFCPTALPLALSHRRTHTIPTTWVRFTFEVLTPTIYGTSAYWTVLAWSDCCVGCVHDTTTTPGLLEPSDEHVRTSVHTLGDLDARRPRRQPRHAPSQRVRLSWLARLSLHTRPRPLEVTKPRHFMVGAAARVAS